MPNCIKSAASVLIWLLISELMCLVVAVSFAIMNASYIRYLSLICGITVHILLLANCAKKIALLDTAHYRITGNRTGQWKPVLLALISMIPQAVTIFVLFLNSRSILMMNLFPLLNAHFLQVYRLVFDGKEEFAAVSLLRKVIVCILPVVSAAAFWIGYQLEYIPALAKIDAAKHTQ